MESTEYLPLGSVVIVRGAVRKVMIIARGLAAKFDTETSMFDYAGCFYPEGLMGDQLLYFNHPDIDKVVFSGFSDEDDVLMVKNINDWAASVSYERADPAKINEQLRAASQGTT